MGGLAARVLAGVLGEVQAHPSEACVVAPGFGLLLSSATSVSSRTVTGVWELSSSHSRGPSPFVPLHRGGGVLSVTHVVRGLDGTVGLAALQAG